MADPSHSPVPYKTYVFVWLALVALTLVNVALATAALGSIGIWIALGIASVQAGLVLLIFMHLQQESPMFRYGMLTLLIIVIISIGLTFVDVLYR